MSLLKLEHINTGYGKKQVLFDVNLDVQEGETVLLVGANGSGKSTLLQVAYRLLPLWEYDGSKLKFGDKDISKKSTHDLLSMRMSYIPQKGELFNNLLVEENLRLSFSQQDKRYRARLNWVRLLEDFQFLKPILKQRASSLSGGERKLLSLAMISIHSPKLLLFDEPFSGISSSNIDTLSSIFVSLVQEGASLLLVEHRHQNVHLLNQKIIQINQGHIN